MLFFQTLRQKAPPAFSYWIFPLLSGTTWLITLITLLAYHYTLSPPPHYPSMETQQTIPYISDIGAQTLKPLFITLSALTTLLLTTTLILSRHLRHRGRLAQNLTTTEKVLSGFSIGFASVGTLGLILLSVFDTWRYRSLHNIFLCLFLGGFILSSVASCWEYQMLGMHFREIPTLRYSFWLKLIFIILEVVLAIAFGATLMTGASNTAAVLEWTLGFGFSFYVFSFIPDLLPAIETKNTTTNNTNTKNITTHKTNQSTQHPQQHDLEKQDDHDHDLEKQDNDNAADFSFSTISMLVVPRPVVVKD